MPTTPVSAENDVTAGPGLHLLMLCYCPDIYECAAPMNWTPGSWADRHCLTVDVLFNSQRIVLDGHDLGPLLSHMPFVDPWRSFRSSRKTVYNAARVKANSTALACVDERCRMMACSEITLPSGFNFTNPGHNLFIGMDELDELKGDVAIACSIVTDLIMLIVSPPKGPADAIKDVGLEKTTKQFFSINEKKLAVSAIVGLIGSAVISNASGGREPYKVKLKQGNGWAEQEYTLEYDPSSGSWTTKGKANTVGRDKKTFEDKVYDPSREPRDIPRKFSWGEKL